MGESKSAHLDDALCDLPLHAYSTTGAAYSLMIKSGCQKCDTDRTLFFQEMGL